MHAGRQRCDGDQADHTDRNRGRTEIRDQRRRKNSRIRRSNRDHRLIKRTDSEKRDPKRKSWNDLNKRGGRPVWAALFSIIEVQLIKTIISLFFGNHFDACYLKIIYIKG